MISYTWDDYIRTGYIIDHNLNVRFRHLSIEITCKDPDIICEVYEYPKSKNRVIFNACYKNGQMCMDDVLCNIEIVAEYNITKEEDLYRMVKELILYVNPVTAYHRHGNEIPKRRLDELSNKQIDIEHALRDLYDGEI